jgi:hypothetical protein
MDEREIARQLRKAQALNAKLAVGFFGGLVVGILIAAYVVMPAYGIGAALLTILVAAIAGRWIVLTYLAR